MVTLTEGMHTGEFIGEMAMGIGYHSDPATIASGKKLVAGHIVGQITASKKYVELAPAAADGSQTAAGILYAGVDASANDAPGVIVKRGPMAVNANDLTFPAGISEADKAAALAALLGLGIKAA